MSEIAAKLGTFLEQFEGKPTKWGTDDCSAVCGLWARENGWHVEMPRYSSEREARRLIAEAGGLLSLWSDIADKAGIQDRFGEPPQLGDIGLIDTRRFGPTGVIIGAGGLCCRRIENGGFWMVPRSYLKVWAIT